MAELSKERVLEFQRIFKKEYKKELSYEKAYEAAHNLVSFFDLLLEIDMRQNPQNYAKKEIKKDKDNLCLQKG